MAFALTATAIVILALLGEVMIPRVGEALARVKARRQVAPMLDQLDPGRELRAEARARELLKSCVNDEEWAMYRDLGFIRVWSTDAGCGRRGTGADVAPDGGEDGARDRQHDGARASADGRAGVGGLGQDGRDAAAGAVDGERPGVLARLRRLWQGRGPRGANTLGRARDGGDPPCAYLIYPHKPIVAYVPQTGRLLNEYCVEFPDRARPYGSARLPDSDDVLAKWMALTGDERRLLRKANMHLPGRQVNPQQVKRDLWRLRQWERVRARRAGVADGSRRVPAS
jgi:hypothetical protein